MDFASPMAYSQHIQNNFKVKLVGTTQGIDKGVVNTHSLDHFSAEPLEAAGENVKVIRNSAVKSMKSSLKVMGQAGGVAMAAGFLGYDIKEDLKQDESKAEKAKDIGIDVGKSAFQFAGDELIMTGAIALAPETMGLSLIAGVATSVLFKLGVEYSSPVSLCPIFVNHP
jgi:hypothetical protein